MLRRLNLTNFRSYRSHQLELHPEITVVAGPNATGKTNLLEAIFTLATTKSWRARDRELINHGQSIFRIEGVLDDKSTIALGYQSTTEGSTKVAFRDTQKRPLSAHLGDLRVVLFEPNDLLLLLGAPSLRRRYLDFILLQSSRGYLKSMHNYRRVLAQRNRLLSTWRGQESELFAWNIKLAELAAEIDAQRRQLVSRLGQNLVSYYQQIAGEEQPLKLTYLGFEADDYASQFLAKLEQTLGADVAAGFTTTGPHRDDLAVEFKGGEVSTTASRGELRTIILSLKQAERAYILAETGVSPILLLDDVFSELDERRRVHLMGQLDGTQTVITTTNADHVTEELPADYRLVSTREAQNA